MLASLQLYTCGILPTVIVSGRSNDLGYKTYRLVIAISDENMGKATVTPLGTDNEVNANSTNKSRANTG